MRAFRLAWSTERAGRRSALSLRGTFPYSQAMERCKNILLVLNPESEQLVASARTLTLARQNRASLHVVVILEHLPLDELPLGTRTLLGILHGDKLREMIEQRQRRLLRTGLAGLSTEGIDLSTSVERSHAPFLTVVQRVLPQGHDLVIKTAEHVTGPRAVLFHPTDRHLMRKCPCPAWMIRPKQRHTDQRILAAVDSFPDDEINANLNRHILDLARSQAVRDDAELHVVHVYHVRSTTSPDLAIVRLHGRNRATWAKKGISAAERFNYLYSDEEPQRLAGAVNGLGGQAQELHVLFNNCYRDNAQRNARDLQVLMSP